MATKQQAVSNITSAFKASTPAQAAAISAVQSAFGGGGGGGGGSGAVNAQGQIVGAGGQILGVANTADRPGAGSPRVSTPAIYSADTLAQTPKIQVPIMQLPETDYRGLALGALSSTGLYNADGTAKEPTITKTETKTETPEVASTYQRFLKAMGISQEQPERLDRNKIMQEAGVTGLDQRVRDLKSQIDLENARLQSSLLQTRGVASKEGVVEAVYGGQSAQLEREAAIRLLPLTAMYNAELGNLNAAKEQVNTFIADENAYQDRLYRYNSELRSMAFQYATTEQKNALEEKRIADANRRDDMKTLNQYKKDFAEKAIDNGQASLLGSVIKATTVDEVLTLGSQLKGNDIDAQYKKLQIQKLQSEIDANKPLTGEYASVINGAAGLVANVKKEQVKTNIATALASGNYVNAYAEIANAVSDGLTGTPKTKFDDARTDIGIMKGMRDAITNYANNGGDMNLLVGTEEQIKKKLGIDSGKASALATQLWREFQTYRSNMTGAAFTPQESRDYASVNPTLGKSLSLNLSVIDGALSQLTNRVTSTINQRIPDAKKIWDLATGTEVDVKKENIFDEVVGVSLNKEDIFNSIIGGGTQFSTPAFK